MASGPRIVALLHGLIGDTLMRVPALRALRETLPEMHLTAICDPITAPALAGDGLFDEVWVWPRKGRSILGEFSDLRKLRAQRYDVLLDFYFGSRSPRMVFASGAGRRIGPVRHAWARGLYTDPLPYPLDQGAHMLDRILPIVRPLGVETLRREWIFPIHPAVADRAAPEVDADDAVYVAGAGHVSKRLDEEVERRTLAALGSGTHGPRRVWLVRDQRDPRRGDSLLQIDGVEALPSLGIPELAATFAKAGLILTPDSGPLHIALGCAPRVLTWFLSTDPEIHHATREGHRWLYRVNCEVQPCNTRLAQQCELECRNSLDVASLLEAVEALWGGPSWTAPSMPARDPRDLLRV